MMTGNIPFQEAGIEQELGECVLEEIARISSESSGTSIDVHKVSEAVGISGAVVRRVLYLMLTLGKLRATFTPRHRLCRKIIGREEETVTAIQSKAESGGYGQLCLSCGEPIEDSQDIEIQMNFWRLKADG